MDDIFPPIGDQDESRFLSVKKDDRDYMWFCLEFCSRVVLLRPDHIEALELAANHYTELGYFADGLRLDERLTLLRPDDPGILYNLSCSLALTGRVDEALDRLEQAVRRGYRDHHHMAADRDLGALRENPRFGRLLTLAARNG